ncbi:hypothetical protein [Romboutsia lituseburensis]|uniref:hypothetical protein n=1 Tax=Romboutsia lituseburensis TaxID=1537 RepID=UPI0022EA1362|nr:hypothetical protein [Romboutsia lituseburensis]
MYKYAQLDKENICVGYKSILSKVDQEGYILLKEDVDLSDILYRKYDVVENTFSKEKYYPEIEEIPNDIDVLKNKIDILKAENLRLKEVEKEQDKMIMDNAYKMTILEASMGGI